MTAALIIMIILFIILFFLFLMQRREIRSIIGQLRDIAGKDTNELIHSNIKNAATDRLINEINEVLKGMRRSEIAYRRKRHDLEQMITNISHDLRTPLTSAMGYIGMMRNTEMPAEEREKELLIVENRLRRLEELTDSFFEFSKVVSGNRLPEREELNLVEILERAVGDYYDDFCSQDRKIIFCCPRQKLGIVSNRHMLVRVFENLIGNAYKHGTGDLKISVSISEHVTIRFENGLDDQRLEIEHVFDEFYTTDISKTKGDTGLGLAIAKQFTEVLGGRITAEYDGKCFSVTMEI